MTNIQSAKPWDIPKSKHRSNPQRPKAARTVSPKAEGYGVANKNPSGDHLTPDHVSGGRASRSGTSIGVDKMATGLSAHPARNGRNPQGSHLDNTMKGPSGRKGRYAKRG